jgi:hypothetical protein
MLKILFLSISSVILAYGTPEMDNAFHNAFLTQSETVSDFERARDFINSVEDIEPSFIEIGQYQPGLMSDDMYGIWLEYKSRNRNNFGFLAHYFRLRDIVRIELSRNAFGVCQMKLTGAERHTGYYWKDPDGWQRGLGTLHFRADDCELLTQTAKAFAKLAELDGGEVSFQSKLD